MSPMKNSDSMRFLLDVLYYTLENERWDLKTVSFGGKTSLQHGFHGFRKRMLRAPFLPRFISSPATVTTSVPVVPVPPATRKMHFGWPQCTT